MNRDADASRLAADSIQQGSPTAWFEQLYAEAADGRAIVPWDSDEPNPLLVTWLSDLNRRDGRALVVGSGLGRDAEYVAAQGFDTTAFDVSPTAVDGARARFPDSRVDYVVADLLDPPTEWVGAFDLVIESITVQSMPVDVRKQAIANIVRTVAPGGELLVISGVREEGVIVDGPPWPLTETELGWFESDGLEQVDAEQIPRPDNPHSLRWKATFRAPDGPSPTELISRRKHLPSVDPEQLRAEIDAVIDPSM